MILGEFMVIIKLREHEKLIDQAALWFHSKWDTPMEIYRDSIKACINKKENIPQWYVVMENEEIIGGIGVIDNDYHDRIDLTPNVCALYVEEAYRCKQIAKRLLQYVSKDMHDLGIDTLYLITDHTSFYERYAWSFLCMVQNNDGSLSRMYIHNYIQKDL